MVNRHRMIVASQPIAAEVSGIDTITLPKNTSLPLKSLKVTGSCFQDGTPTPGAPIDIVCNNGTIRAHRLPLQYQLLTDLGSYEQIDLDIKTTNDMEIEVAWMRTKLNAQYLYKSDNDSSGSSNTTAYISTQGYWRFGDQATALPFSLLNTRYETIQNSDGVFLNGEQIASYGTVNAFTSSSNFRIGGGSNLSIEYLKIRESGILVRDLVPVYDTVGDTYGFYDFVNNRFYTQTASGFIPGNSIDSPNEIVADGNPTAIKTRTLNLLNPEDVDDINIYINRNSGSELAPSNTSQFRASNFISVEENTGYYFGMIPSSASTAGMAWYDNSQNYISGVSATQMDKANMILTSPQNAAYVRFSWRVDKGYNDDWEHTVYLCKVGELDHWVPYYNTIASAENLYAVGDYKDKQDIISGEITRCVGIKVLDGTEVWGEKNATNGLILTRINDMLNQSSAPLIVTHGEWSASAEQNSNKWRIVVGPYLACLSSQETTADFKAWLAAQYAAGTPVIVLYPLASPITEQISPKKIKSVNTITTNGSISATYWKAPF